MAARLHPAPPGPDSVDLRHLSARDLHWLLEEETAGWQHDLDWDFTKSADLVRRFVDLHALSGTALMENGEAIAYIYYVLEDNKGLVGDLYVRRDRRNRQYESCLLEAGVQAIREHPQITRVESQILMLDFDPNRALPFAADAASYSRNFMRAELAKTDLGEGPIGAPIFIERWSDHYHDPAATVIADAYSGHVDSRVNDQYRSVAGARRFLYNIVQFPGCGTFFRPASYAAFEAATGRLCGVSLTSLVSPECGHVTQICVSSAVRGKGVGHELLRRSLATLKDVGCRAASLTVTTANRDAVALYEKVGFRTTRRFSAYAWEWPG
jgi:ribosomal protein S18 acetylase RimI-like enzyme